MDPIIQHRSVLIAETDALVGMDLSDALMKAGYRVIGPFATASMALTAMEQERPTFAIVDVMLRDGVCTALGHELRQQGIPFLVHSSLEQNEPQAIGFQGIPWLTKPTPPKDAVILLDELAFLALGISFGEAGRRL